MTVYNSIGTVKIQYAFIHRDAHGFCLVLKVSFFILAFFKKDTNYLFTFYACVNNQVKIVNTKLP